MNSAEMKWHMLRQELMAMAADYAVGHTMSIAESCHGGKAVSAILQHMSKLDDAYIEAGNVEGKK